MARWGCSPQRRFRFVCFAPQPLLCAAPGAPGAQNMHQVHEYQPSEHGSEGALHRKGCGCCIQ